MERLLERDAELRAVGAVVEALDKPVILIAQSMGTLVAELVAVDHSDRVQALVLLSPVPLAGVHLVANGNQPGVFEVYGHLCGRPAQENISGPKHKE